MQDKEHKIYGSFSVPPQSYWMASTGTTNYPTLQEDTQVDVAVIGGGMVGITTAYLLKKEGLTVAVLEADHILQGTTGHTTAKITSQHNLIYDKIKQQMGEEKARQYADANEAAIRTIAALIKENEIDCDFEWRSSYVYTHLDEYVQKISDEAKTAASLGIKASYLDKIPLPFPIKAAVRFDNQAQFHPRKYLLALAGRIPGEGSEIFEQSRVVDIEEGSHCNVITERGHKVTAKNVIVASHYPFYDKPGFYFTRIYQERSYALGVITKEKLSEGMYITAEDPGRSLRSQKYEQGELIIASGEHHKTGHGETTSLHYDNLATFMKETFEVIDIPYRWSTQDCVTMDDVPFTGHLTSGRKNIYVATGFRKWGMTNSTASAMILRDLITKGESPWEPVYSPSRFIDGNSTKTFLKENADVAGQFVSGKLESVSSIDKVELLPGQGKILQVNGQKAGVYKDGQGQLHMVDSTCTHLGCEVKWNDAEKTWDCPCHGSRYTYEGDIVEGPTVKPLARLNPKAE
jgi:glycine/D-amino acid oxidase-like deaminating enzyme/nitrite reductase/ring-hydroxylating ferredoxin subunit